MDKLYVQYSRVFDGTPSIGYSTYEGLSQDTVLSLLAGLNATDIEFLTEAEFIAATE